MRSCLSKLGQFFKNHRVCLILVIIYRICFDAVYEQIIFPIYGTTYKYVCNPTTCSIALSWVLFIGFLLPACKFFRLEKGVSNVVLFLIFLISIVPFTTMARYNQFESSYVWANTLYFAILYFMTWIFRKRIHVKRICIHTRFPYRLKIRWLALLMAAVALFVCGKYSHFRVNFSIDQVYDLRYEAGTYNLPTILNYLFRWATWVIPFLIGYYLRKKKNKYAAVLFVLQIFMFGYDGMKGPFFFAVVVVLINLFLPKINMSSLNTFFLYGFSGITLLSYIVYVIYGNYVLAQSFLNRLGLIPNIISYAYYKFFTQNVPDYFRTSFLRYFGFKSPYSNISYMICEWYFGYSQGANDGLIADAVTNMGIAGIFIMPVAVAFVLGIVDIYTQNLDNRINVCVALYLTLMLMSMFILPILLTGGLLAILLLLNWIDKENKVTVSN